MKIVFCIDQIDHIGGTERVTIAKANALSAIDGYEVFIIVGFKRWDNDSIQLNANVKLHDLEVHYYENYGYNIFKGIFLYLRLKKEHRRKLASLLNQISPDVVVSVGGVEKQFLPRLNITSNPVFIREMHFHKYFRRKIKKSLLDKVIAMAGEYEEYLFNINKYDCIAVLTQQDYEDNWKNNPKVIVIPNPLIQSSTGVSSLNHKIVISVGRLVESKNFSSMISAWRSVNRLNPEWKLHIYGDGPFRSILQKKIEEERLNDSVELCGFASDINSKLQCASIFFFFSAFEGFGLVLIEAMSHGLPVVSYDCQYGPRDIIDQGKDGYYVPLNDEKSFSERINLLISDEKKRKEMGNNAYEKSKLYSLETIVDKWTSTYSRLINEKKCGIPK